MSTESKIEKNFVMKVPAEDGSPFVGCGYMVILDEKQASEVFSTEEEAEAMLHYLLNREYYRNIKVKTVGKSEFVLQLQAAPEGGYDYIIAGPNWLSGRLKAQGFDEREIFEYFDEVTEQTVKDAWADYHEKALFSGRG